MKNIILSSFFFLISLQLMAQDYNWSAGDNFIMQGSNSEWSFDFTNTTGDGLWHVWAPATSSILSVRNSGRVGILESSPSGLLHINGGNRTGIDGKFLLSSRASGFGQFQIMNPAEEETSISFISKGSSFGVDPVSSDGESHVWVLGAGIWGTQGDLFSIGNRAFASSHAGDGKIISIASNGQVGIGTSNLNSMLSISSLEGISPLMTAGFTATTNSGGIHSSYGGITLTNGINSTIAMRLLGNGVAQITTDATGRQLSFATGEFEEAMRINGMGNVGIGVSDIPSQYKLAVEGTIGAREIKVESNAWPDYVFADSYKLTSLEETERFIQQNHHLPNIPSAAEVELNGVALGEMNTKLLQKIEELTLYLIEQNKQIEEQGKEIELLKKQIGSSK